MHALTRRPGLPSGKGIIYRYPDIRHACGQEPHRRQRQAGRLGHWLGRELQRNGPYSGEPSDGVSRIGPAGSIAASTNTQGGVSGSSSPRCSTPARAATNVSWSFRRRSCLGGRSVR